VQYPFEILDCQNYGAFMALSPWKNIRQKPEKAVEKSGRSGEKCL
jgi:hypothetical protein